MTIWHHIKLCETIEYGVNEEGYEYWEAEIQDWNEKSKEATDLVAIRLVYNDDNEQLTTDVEYLVAHAQEEANAAQLVEEAKQILLLRARAELGTDVELA
ncbi:tRNA1(Val) A37 N6-methylase TrmN6 [Paenibacillus phyllosphaerae]|uniref:tRNA1(Val) A37 N6-methylase TrmN6 n=1 Tax=Paenibacillus phyllosphaerae TaxID=274593 RepID=A0A7W5FNT2_9BACL|nr:hypothetical protein [Paenibacillus phyllosphaerae]MBB3111477.1 tRNA1(Val) A37 N6-methylase TrmN6 [Paenibacillus phyllosphaerae]